MDPNRCLSIIRDAAARIINGGYAIDDDATLVGDAEILAESVDALDGWLSSGGFKPEAWEPNR